MSNKNEEMREALARLIGRDFELEERLEGLTFRRTPVLRHARVSLEPDICPVAARFFEEIVPSGEGAVIGLSGGRTIREMILNLEKDYRDLEV